MREMLLKATVYGAGDRYVPASSVMQPDDEQRFVELGALPPPYNPSTLAMLVEHSDALRQCIDAYSVNIEAFGHRWEPVIDLESDDAKEKLRAAMEMESGGKAEVSDAEVDERFEVVKREMRREKLHLESFFEFCSLDSSFPELRQKTRFDQETHGNAYWEVLRNAAGDVVQFVYVPGHTVRLLPLAKDPVEVDVQVRVSPLKFLKIKTPRRLRKYVQIVEPTAARTVYFKEFGDTRVMSQKSGAYFEDEAALKKADPEDFPANEIIHFRIHSPRSAYGVPRWIGTLLAVLGSRMAEEVNYLYFSNKSVPPLAILVSGGRVNDETAKRIEEFIETQIKGKANFHKILVLDAAAIDDGSINSGRAKIDIKPLTMAQHNDALFQEYQKQNTEKVGSAMRLPRILRGDSREVNRACYSADTETLTENGWKRWMDVAPDERIAAFSPRTGEVLFVVPEKLYVYDVVDEEMWHFHNAQTDCLVTAHHKMLVRSAQTRAKHPPWREVRASAIPFNRFEVRVAADSWRGKRGPKSFLLPKDAGCQIERGHDHKSRINFDDWLEFLGYWISEGGLVQTDCKAATYLVHVGQKNPRVLPKIRACLDRLGWKYSSSVESDGMTRFHFNNRCLRAWLSENCGTHAENKRIPWGYLNLSTRRLHILFDAMMDGDGSMDVRENRTSGCYYTSSSVLAGQVQRLLVQLGRRSEIIPGTRCLRVMHSEYRTTRLNAIGQERTPPCVTRERYTGMVYCFSVPGFGFFVTRRNGKVAIQGNTAEAALSFAEIQVFSPQRESFDFMINRQVLSQMGVRYWRFRSNAPSLRDPAALAGVVRDLVNAGVLTPAEARELAEGIFNREFRVIAADWTRLPMQLTLAGFTSDGGAPEPLAPGEFPPGAPPLPGTGAAGTPGEKHPPASQGSGVTPPVKGAEWLKRVRAKLRRGDVSGVVEDLVAVRDQLRAREAIEADVEFRKLASVK
jgi:PBSX family phage portal protein